MLGLPVEDVNEWANRAYIIFGVIAIGATALALIASFFIWRTGSVLSRMSDEKIAGLQSEASTARLAQERLQTTNLQLQQTVEQERTERLKLEARVAWRRIAPERIDRNRALLAKHPSIINIEFIAGDPETRYYAEQIIDVFDKAGWHVGMSAPLVATKLDNRNLLENKNNSETGHAKDALADLGVAFELVDEIPKGVSIGSPDPNATVKLLITPRVPE